MNRFLLWPLMTAALLASCARPAKIEQEKQPNPIGPAGRPLIRVKDADSGTAVTPGGNAAAKPTVGITPEEDIVYTDPDNPEAGIPELADVLSAPKRGPWEQSETIAKQRSVREGKPLLIWFTDSQRSPMCKAVSQELFSTNEFGNWATEKLVRLKVDAVVSKDAMRDMDSLTAEDYRTQVRNYNADLKKRYKVMGYPSLIMLSPSGAKVGDHRGYKRGDAEFLWGKLKHAEAVSIESDKSWRVGLERKGYREWRDRKDRRIFARLTSYSDGTLTFIEPDGARSRTKESNLSDDDRAWIAEQKKLRKLQ